MKETAFFYARLVVGTVLIIGIGGVILWLVFA